MSDPGCEMLEARFELRQNNSRVKASSNSSAGIHAQEQPRRPEKEGGIGTEAGVAARFQSRCKQVDAVQIAE